jgi:Tfp pilus assembly protein PilO
MINLTREQLKIIKIGIVVLVFLLGFWFFVYIPQSKKLTSIKRQLSYIESQISEINKLIENKELTEAVKKLKLELDKNISQLPSGEEDIIDVLSQKAKDLNIEVKDIIPSSSRILEDEVSGYKIEELSISMKFSCEYKVLGEYLDILKDNFPVLVRINSIDVKGRGEGKPVLDVSLQISTYLSKEI